MTGRFAGKSAIVTGASRGIGLSIAQRLVSEGARVCITARKPDALEEAVESMPSASAIFVAGTADDGQHQDEAVAATLAEFGSVDFLVNNTGINPHFGPMIDLDPLVAEKILRVNVVAALTWTQKVHRAWMREHGGAVVNVASITALRPAPGIGMYATSKAALIHVTEELAVELGPAVRVNAVAPGVVKTRFASALYEGKESEVASAYPLKRLGIPEDVSGTVAFLLSSDASWITGQTIVMDGGVTMTGGMA